jgi:hypothetical protein
MHLYTVRKLRPQIKSFDWAPPQGFGCHLIKENGPMNAPAKHKIGQGRKFFAARNQKTLRATQTPNQNPHTKNRLIGSN